MNIVFIISIIVLCIYLVKVYIEGYAKKDRKDDTIDMCSKQQCDDCEYKKYCYLYDEDIENEKD